MPQTGAPYIHSGDPAYAPPLLRAPSPSSSIGTDYGPDETSYEDARKSQNQFVNDIQARLKLNEPRTEEIQANKDPLLPKPKDAQEEQVLYFQVLANLRRQVQHLEESELFEQTVLRGSLVTEEQEPSSADIDSIMRSMMVLSPSITPASPIAPTIGHLDIPQPDASFDAPSTIQPGTPGFFSAVAMPDSGAVTSTPGRRSTRLKVKSRRP